MLPADQLSPHFTVAEFCRTREAPHAAANLSAFLADGAAQRNASALLVNLVEPFRAYAASVLGRDVPIFTHSGFRYPGLNASAGGQKNSQHMTGQALDHHLAGVPILEAFRMWRAFLADKDFGQLILEGRPYSWIHVSLGSPWREAARCRQVLYTKAWNPHKYPKSDSSWRGGWDYEFLAANEVPPAAPSS